MGQCPVLYHLSEIGGSQMGKLPGSFFGRTHTVYTGTNVMSRFIRVFFHIEAPVLPMIRHPLPSYHFHPAFSTDFV